MYICTCTCTCNLNVDWAAVSYYYCSDIMADQLVLWSDKSMKWSENVWCLTAISHSALRKLDYHWRLQCTQLLFPSVSIVQRFHCDWFEVSVCVMTWPSSSLSQSLCWLSGPPSATAPSLGDGSEASVGHMESGWAPLWGEPWLAETLPLCLHLSNSQTADFRLVLTWVAHQSMYTVCACIHWPLSCHSAQ